MDQLRFVGRKEYKSIEYGEISVQTFFKQMQFDFLHESKILRSFKYCCVRKSEEREQTLFPQKA